MAKNSNTKIEKGKTLTERAEERLGSATSSSITSLIPNFNMEGLQLNSNGIYESKHTITGSPVGASAARILIDKLSFEMENKDLADRRKEKGQSLIEVFHKLKGQVLVDLGAGEDASGYAFAKMVDAKAYIGIEAYFSKKLLWSIERVMKYGKESIPVTIISEDMLNGLRRFPKDSVSVMANGIDTFVIGSGSYLDDKVAPEIRRVLHPKGLYIDNGSGIYPTEHRRYLERDLIVFTKQASLLK